MLHLTEIKNNLNGGEVKPQIFEKILKLNDLNHGSSTACSTPCLLSIDWSMLQECKQRRGRRAMVMRQHISRRNISGHPRGLLLRIAQRWDRVFLWSASTNPCSCVTCAQSPVPSARVEMPHCLLNIGHTLSGRTIQGYFKQWQK